MFFDQGDWDEAEKLEVQNLEIRERVMGAEHADSVMSRACLAQTGFDHLFISYHFPTPPSGFPSSYLIRNPSDQSPYIRTSEHPIIHQDPSTNHRSLDHLVGAADPESTRPSPFLLGLLLSRKPHALTQSQSGCRGLRSFSQASPLPSSGGKVETDVCTRKPSLLRPANRPSPHHFVTGSEQASSLHAEFKAAPPLDGKLPLRPRPVFDLQEVHVLPD